MSKVKHEAVKRQDGKLGDDRSHQANGHKETISPRRRTKDGVTLGREEVLGREEALGMKIDEKSSKGSAAATRLRSFIKVPFTMESRLASGRNALKKKRGR